MKKMCLFAAAAAALAGCSETGLSDGGSESIAASNCRLHAAEEYRTAEGEITVTPVDSLHYAVAFDGKTYTCEVTESGDVVGIGTGL